jgi:poly [ADP-ribose] polymerase 1
MLDSLMELEVAYNLMKVKDEDKGKEKEMHPLDLQYSKLKTQISVLDRESEEFGHLQAYVRNTHAETHQQYSLDIVEVFKVERHDEKKRHKVLDKWKNRHLLWHGSRVTNYPGILSQVKYIYIFFFKLTRKKNA